MISPEELIQLLQNASGQDSRLVKCAETEIAKCADEPYIIYLLTSIYATADLPACIRLGMLEDCDFIQLIFL